VDLPDFISVVDLSNRMAVRTSVVVKCLMNMGILATINQLIDADTAEIVCVDFGHTPNRVSGASIESEIDTNVVDDIDDFFLRPPIVAVMGHVDHGKTTLLDIIRKSNVVQKEAGGITQHVAAYQIRTSKSKKLITFIDTPGHAAFSAIRSRGATVTDIVVLVVAADDGVKDQTVEAIAHAKAQNVPVIVAINKMDKPGAASGKVKAELLSNNVILEEYGGDALSCEISALKNTNIDELEELILLQAEIMQIKANVNRKAFGTVLESRVDKGRGIVASVIIQNGTLRQGDVFVAGSSFGKIRTMYNDRGERVTAAGPSIPIDVVGFNSAPEPGDVLSVVSSEQKAREIVGYRSDVKKQKSHGAVKKSTDMFSQTKQKDLNLVIKADVFGSLEAICLSIEELKHEEICVKIVDRSVGVVTESDIDFALNTGAEILGFNVGITSAAKEKAISFSVNIRQHTIIYKLMEEIKQMMGALLEPTVEERYTGRAEVRKIFFISKFGTIAGCYVTDGVVKRSDSKIKVFRDGQVIFEGKMRSMKREKNEIKESRQSYECGILADGFNDFLEGDTIESYDIVFIQRKIE
jgi:translation initiation factor IF-2